MTKAERRVVARLARGETTKEAAFEVGISDITVRVLVLRAVRRIGVRNRRELLLWARSSTEMTLG